MKRLLIVATTASFLAGFAASAHHGEHHEPPVPTPGGEHHSPPVTVTPPVVEAPPVVITPPPTLNLPSNFQLGILAPNILPTDISGLRSGADAAKLQKIPTAQEMIQEATAKDSRYDFIGDWMFFSASHGASGQQVEADRSQSPANDENLQKGRVASYWIAQSKPIPPVFMPTSGANHSKVNDEHRALKDGAVIVRGGSYPVFVSATVNGQKVMTRVSKGALAMISAFDDRVITVNLTDSCCGALMMYVPSKEASKLAPLSMSPGQIAEVYAPSSKPISNLVATKIQTNERIGADCGLLVSRCHYVRALKKYNLASVLSKPDLSRVLKTAAAVHHAQN